jgi:hypothetical protein
MGGLVKDGFTLIRCTAGRMMRETGLAFDKKGSLLQGDIAFMEPLNRHRNILPLYEQIP